MRELLLKKRSNKKIYILDCDYLYETSKIPNYKAMKLSSYHKQQGDSVTLITEEYHLTGSHDILYFIRELRHTPFPPGIFLEDERTILMGKEFEFYGDAKELPDVAAAVRPDYNLYPEVEDNLYTRISYVQFLNKTTWLLNKQPWERSRSRGVLVVDDTLWDAPDHVIIQSLEELRYKLNIGFLHPIKIKKLLNPQVLEAFLQLKLAKFIKIVYNNNIGEDLESIKKIIDIMKTIKEKFSYLNIGSIPVKIITTNHWDDKQNILYDFERCLKVMNYAQLQKVRINFRYPRIRLASPSWTYFQFFKVWSNHYHTYSYIEALLITAVRYNKVNYDKILQDPSYWHTPKITQAVHLVARYPDLIKQYGFSGWGGTISRTSELIDYHYVKEKAIENNIF